MSILDVRQIQASEVEEVLDLIDTFNRPQAPRPAIEELQVIYKSILESGGCIVGAFCNTSMVGTCTVNLCPNLSWSGRPYAIIENVIVAREYRNLGFGKALLKFGKDFAQSAGCYKVALMTGSNDPATHRFYSSAGFTANKQGYQVRFNA
ncbi:GNAT family N-acetyltransferase [Saccharospirillum alexandrii]|uniref:GNAT family N-acetyltransferase n=1 Tax=Saccharospirillum alexandrii TaxID=2448477 RepID=UPI003CCC4874